MFKDDDPELLHTKIMVKSEGEAEALLAGAAFSTAHRSLATVSSQPHILANDLRQYTKGLLLSHIPHTPELLNAFLSSQET